LLPDTIQLDGQKLTIDQLLQNLKGQKQQGQNLSIIINSDKGVAVEQLVQVMDRLRADGFTSVSLAARKP
ncbi:ExbD/TolR family protein, partial [Acinetobacter nectaris]